MKVYLAGYNIDARITEELKTRASWDRDNVTPETLSASYARISRDPRDIDILRHEACEEVEKARKSNESIIFGMGHSSVAEHAVFNFDVIGISRLAVESIQQFRLVSFTEKSQRYITLDGDYFIPGELTGTPLEQEFRDVISFQNDTYFRILQKLRQHLFKKHDTLVGTKNGERTVEGWAKEDARYVVSLATLSQFGMTINARNLEYMLRRLRSSSLAEVKDVAEALYERVCSLAPSIIKFTVPSDYDLNSSSRVREAAGRFQPRSNNFVDATESVSLAYHTPDPDEHLCAAILFSGGNITYGQSLSMAREMSGNDRLSLVMAALQDREFYDPVDRVFEIADFVFELVVSASNYAQLKRHRISTQITRAYDVSLGYTVPDSIVEIGMNNEFQQAMEKSAWMHDRLSGKYDHLKNYILTNAHRRTVLFKLNGRELYHFIGLREDEHAQWDIRKTASDIHEQVARIAPLTALMLTGRDGFNSARERIFGQH